MPVLRNPRHELFAQARSQGYKVSEAYRIAGGKSPNTKRQGDQLAARPDVKARISELLRGQADLVVERAALGKEEILSEILRNAQESRKFGNYAASNKAYELYGLELGMFVRRSEQRRGKLDPIEDAKDDDLLELIARGIEELAGDGVQVDRALLAKAVRVQELPDDGPDPAGRANGGAADDGPQGGESPDESALAL